MKNNTIALLIGIFIVISLASFFYSPRGVTYVTGYAASGDGYTAFNLTEEVSILVSGDVFFGSGRTDANASETVLDSALGTYNYYFTNITSDVGPSPSPRLANMVFDSDRGVFVLYGGVNWISGEWYNDTWEFDYSTKQWTHVTSADAAAVPQDGSGLFFPGMAYDSFAKRTILFGGSGSTSTRLNQTWEYNGTNWTNRNPVVSPVAISSPGMAFDRSRNLTVMFGGTNKTSDRMNLTWEYNYSSNNWTLVSTANAPDRRDYPGMTWVSSENKIYLFGGQNSSGDYTNDVWSYDGSDWTEISTIGAPSPDFLFLPYYDSLRDKILVAAVNSSNDYLLTFWDFNPSENSWHRIYDVPEHTFLGEGSFDSNYNVTMFFIGSKNFFLGPYLNETWIYNSSLSSGAVNGSWFPYKDYFFIENDGTVNVSVNFSADKNAKQFIGGTSPSFMLKGVVTESSACPGLSTSYAEMPNASETPGVLCPLLKFPYANDEISAAIKLVIPSDLVAGSKTATVTFTAASTS